ncbi:MAG TPA: transcriptional repressor LexA [Polyangia bacterium]|jgi:repressor LexA|nr:transcriptional repressor LexA [Polyangia bacterium]
MGSLTLVRDEARGVLTDRQQEILNFITSSITERGYPPTLREIGLHFGIRSTNGVNDHLRALEKKGFLQREDLKSRALRPVVLPGAAQARPEPHPDIVEIPVIGRVAAGVPLLAVENVQDTVQIDRFFIGQTREVFALRVKGESMIEDGIFDGDYIFVRKQLHATKGDTVVAMINDEATVKRYYPEGDTIRFQPANAAMQPILVRKRDFKSVNLVGVVVGVYRKMH